MLLLLLLPLPEIPIITAKAKALMSMSCNLVCSGRGSRQKKYEELYAEPPLLLLDMRPLTTARGLEAVGYMPSRPECRPSAER